MAVSLGELIQSIGALDKLDSSTDVETKLQTAVEATRELLNADTAGLLLADGEGTLSWSVTADARAEAAALAQEHLGQGPCVAAFEHTRPVVVADVTQDARWAPILDQLLRSGIRSAVSVPVVLGGGAVGVLDVYRAAPGQWDDSQVAAAQTYAAVLSMLLGATLTAAAASETAGQLQHALTARVQIEQAKGVLMGREGLGEREAWERLRAQARNQRRPVAEVVRDLLGSIDPSITQ